MLYITHFFKKKWAACSPKIHKSSMWDNIPYVQDYV